MDKSVVMQMLGGIGSLLIMLAAHGQIARDVTVVPVPMNDRPQVHVAINVNKTQVAIGDTVEFDFVSNTNGFVTLWNVGTSGRVSRIYPPMPNQLEEGSGLWERMTRQMRVRAGVRYGAGGPNDRFKFKVQGPPGIEHVYLVWTRTAREQPKEFNYRDVEALSKDLQVVERLPPRDWATARVSFEIVDSGFAPPPRPVPPDRPVPVTPPPPPPPPPPQSNIYIFAMGADVAGLTKTNLDARNFTATMQRMFEVPASQVRLVENAYKRDFANGMAWLRQVAGPRDWVFIFFSGHGSTIADDNGDEEDGLDEGFVMYDAEGVAYPNAEHFVRDDQFAQWVAALRTRQVITFIDACHSGGLRKNLLPGKPKFFVGGDLGQRPDPLQAAQKSITGLADDLPGLVYAAAQENEFALEVSDGGLFITRYLQELSSRRHPHLAGAFEATRRIVLQQSGGQQTPTAVGVMDLGHQFNVR